MNYVEALYQYIIGELAECKNNLFICSTSRDRADVVRVANRLRLDGYKVSVTSVCYYGYCYCQLTIQHRITPPA